MDRDLLLGRDGRMWFRLPHLWAPLRLIRIHGPHPTDARLGTLCPLVFLGGFWAALLGAAVGARGMGAHESVIPAVAAPDRRAAAFGLFTAGRGVAWFLGSTCDRHPLRLLARRHDHLRRGCRAGGGADLRLDQPGMSGLRTRRSPDAFA